jgi:hypothetical protein
MAVQPWRKGIITRIKDETHNIRRFWIKVPEVDRFDFVPGQALAQLLHCLLARWNKRVRIVDCFTRYGGRHHISFQPHFRGIRVNH